MKHIAQMTLTELAAYISSYLQQKNMPVVLVGGACVSIYCHNQYQTSDLDFVEKYYTKRSNLKAALAELGFEEQNRYFVRPDVQYFLEFPAGPLAIGDSPVKQLHELKTDLGVLALLTAQDCVRDRLSAFYHWRDKQALQQAIWVAQLNPIDLDFLRAWSQAEAMLDKFDIFLVELQKAQES